MIKFFIENLGDMFRKKSVFLSFPILCLIFYIISFRAKITYDKSYTANPSEILGFKELISPKVSVEESIEKCMRMANFDSEPLLTQAKENARYFYNEYKKAIPKKGLSGYKSHCWKSNYGINGTPYILTSHGLRWSNKAESELLCLPNTFIAGYAKCGTTYLFSFVQRLISMSTNDWEIRQFRKEEDFWVPFKPFRDDNKFKPVVGQLEKHLHNFLPGTKRMENNTNIMLVEGTANIIRDWPRFTMTENDVTNYCLIPTTLPRLFPRSKFITIMRNPINMTYSIFWFSCTHINQTSMVLSRGRDIFHERMMTKIYSFNDCMRDDSSPNITYACTIQDKANYSSCIKQRLHLLDKCYKHVLMDIYSPELPNCGSSWLSVAIYYVNVRKWLKLVRRERLLFLTLEDLKLHPSEVAGDILQFLDLNTSIANSAENMEKIMDIEERRLNVQHKIDYREDKSLHMREDTRHALEVFYHPFNTLLAELLGSDKFMWF